MVRRLCMQKRSSAFVRALIIVGFSACSTTEPAVPGTAVNSMMPAATGAGSAAPAAPPAQTPIPGTAMPGPAAQPGMPMSPAMPPMNPIQPQTPVAMPDPVATAGAPAMPAPMMPLQEPEYTDGPLMGACPDNFTPRSGMNSGFLSDGKMRDFIVYLPNDMSSPRPVFVGITGTEQQSDNFITSGGLNSLTAQGWIVLAPVRLCTSEGRQQECLNGVGESTMAGWVWEPWNDGSREDKWNTDAGQDVRYLENMVRCAAKQWPVDQRRIYLGGISAGGSFTNRNMTFNSKFWAGGVPASGMWYISDGNDSVTNDNADELKDGWCCPRPATAIQMYSSIVIVLFGGANDQYTTRGDMPVTVQYKSEAQIASNVYDAQPNVAVVNCQGTQGHLWPRGGPWNSWMAMTLASHPKGTPKKDFKLPPSPAGYRCALGRFSDLTFE